MKFLLLVVMILFAIGDVYAEPSHLLLSVPFDNVFLNPNQSLSAPYSFGIFHVILCYTPDLATIGNMTWPYEGVFISSSLPVELKTNPNVTGSFADPNGTITIQNTSNTPIVVSCDMG